MMSRDAVFMCTVRNAKILSCTVSPRCQILSAPESTHMPDPASIQNLSDAIKHHLLFTGVA